MKLKTQILFGICFLIIAMTIIMYILPIYFVKKDIREVAHEINHLMIQERKQLLSSQDTWLENSFQEITHNLAALLNMISEESNLSDELVFGKNSLNGEVWLALSRIASYNPQVGFLQAHSFSEDKTAVINSSRPRLKPIKKGRDVEGNVIFSILSNNSQPTEFMGVKLPKNFQLDNDFEYYALYSSNSTTFNGKATQERLDEVAGKRGTMNFKKSSFETSMSSQEALWVQKMQMLRLLTELFVGYFPQNPEEFLPSGIARVDSESNGLVLFSEDVYGLQPLFDDKLFYQMHPPEESSKVSSGNKIFLDEKNEEIFLGETLLLKSTFVTLATPLSNLVRELALASNQIILLEFNHAFWMGFDGEGNKITNEEIGEQIIHGSLNPGEKFRFHNQDYLVAKFNKITEGGDSNLFELVPLGGTHSIISTLVELENNLSKKITLQLFLISLGTMLLVVLFIGRIGVRIVNPISMLAEATYDVVQGKYSEIKLPDIGKRKDEVAILTRSFSDMIKGLEEKEKIRSVLDKVVSKEVAEEILKTQLHLGGEERVVTMLFSDIRGFTHITENLTPKQTIEMLNECMTKISRIIEREGGVIDKYVGDEVMALFGAPGRSLDHALRAVSTGMLIIETLKEWNQQRIQEGLPALDMGIGVHTGLVVVGNMGAQDRLNYTVLGANVNLAARLCQSAKRNQLLISQHTLKEPEIENSFHVKPLDSMMLKGFTEPVQIYEVLSFKWET